jgi:hypothetical protein
MNSVAYRFTDREVARIQVLAARGMDLSPLEEQELRSLLGRAVPRAYQWTFWRLLHMGRVAAGFATVARPRIG